MAKIFIIEDELDICETYTDILEAAGHKVEYVDRAWKAYERLSRARPDVVILDIQLAGDSGMLIASFIRRLSKLQHTKIAVISGHAEMATAAINTYAADLFVHKPVSPEQLRNVVSSLCDVEVVN